MTTYRMYRCNLCGDYILPTDSTIKEGFGVHHSLDRDRPIIFKRPDEAERHICVSCAKGIHDEMRKMTPAKSEK